MLELMARGGMRVGEVLKIRPMDIQDRKLTLAGPKSGKGFEVVFIPQKVADRLKEYVKESGAGPEQRVFPISYNAARIMVRKAGGWWAFICGHMICDGMRPLLPPDPALQLRSSAK